jgi:hypothetical protein
MFDDLKYSRFNSGKLNLMFFGGMKTLVKKLKRTGQNLCGVFKLVIVGVLLFAVQNIQLP